MADLAFRLGKASAQAGHQQRQGAAFDGLRQQPMRFVIVIWVIAADLSSQQCGRWRRVRRDALARRDLEAVWAVFARRCRWSIPVRQREDQKHDGSRQERSESGEARHKGGKGTRLKGGQQSGDDGDQKQNCDSSKPLPGFNFSFSERRLANNLVARMRGEGS